MYLDVASVFGVRPVILFDTLHVFGGCVTRYSLLIVCLIMSLNAQAIDVIEFESIEQRERFQKLSYELRCPKCQNQNLIDSDSQISGDLREEVARLIREGKSDSEIKERMVSLYGDFILYRPPVQHNTLLLWIAPSLMLAIGVLIFGYILFRRSRMSPDVDEAFDESESLDGAATAQYSKEKSIDAQPR